MRSFYFLRRMGKRLCDILGFNLRLWLLGYAMSALLFDSLNFHGGLISVLLISSFISTYYEVFIRVRIRI